MAELPKSSWYHRNRERILAAQNTDEHRAQKRASYRAWREKLTPEEWLAHLENLRGARDKYRSDPERRERELAAGRQRYAWRSEAVGFHESKRAKYRARRELYPWEKLLGCARARATKKGIPFALTKEWAVARWTGCCEVSGIPFVIGRGSGPRIFSPSIDQIRAKAGYTPDNCRFVLSSVNAMKHDGTDEDMMLVAQAIVENLRISNP